MHDASLTAASHPEAQRARQGGVADLAEALRASRRDTLATFAAYELALPGLTVPQHAQLNPPCWELGHLGWFQEYWLARNPQRSLGAAADPHAPRSPALRPDADALYDSTHVPHATRWQLALPDAEATRADLRAQLQATQGLLQALREISDATLYFFRLALHHEDMHHEAALYMARALGIALDDPRWQPQPLPTPPAPLQFAAGAWTLGSLTPVGFAFDNELGGRPVELGATQIDAQALRWAEFLPFVQAGGYADARWWSPSGDAWRRTTHAQAPRYVRAAQGQGSGSAGDGGSWQCWRHGRWQALDLAEAAAHLTRHEAEAWCRWAGRRLPSEAEWERAAISQPDAFRWGEVWEWTASPFEPFPGFVPHPYREYSAPWFDGRPVLRGASHLTQPRMRHPRYRNFFPAERNDLAAGFRSCAL